MKKLEVYNKVVELLKENTRYRDNDNYLCSRFWFDQLKEQGNPKFTSAFEFLELYRDKKLISSDTITRLRRRAEELNPELRGESRNKRLNKQEQVKQDLKTEYK